MVKNYRSRNVDDPFMREPDACVFNLSAHFLID